MKRISVLLLGLIASSAFAQTKISELPAADPLNGAEAVPVVQPAGTVKTTTGEIATYVKTTGAALTRTNDTNVTLTLGGAPTTALLNASSITAGWTGTLAPSRGGTGVGTLTGIAKGNGTSAFTAAASSDVIGTWTGGGTCNSTTFLRGDGQCQIPSGTGPSLTTGTFTATWDVACTTSPTQNFKWVKVGTVVTLTALENVSCTSDSGGFSTTSGATGLPAAIRPDKQQRLLGGFTTDNGVIDVANSCLRIETDGTMSLFRSVTRPCIGTAWTGSGTKAWTVDGDAPAVWTYDTDVVP